MPSQFERRARVRLDAGGARRRAEAAVEARHAQRERQARFIEEGAARRQKVSEAAGRIPVLSTSAELDQAMIQEGTVFPAYQIGESIASEDVLAAIRGNSKGHLLKATRLGEASVGAHFDAYFRRYSPWSLHTNIEGSGELSVCFLGSDLLAKYVDLEDQVDARTDAGQHLLATYRGALGEYQMASSHEVFTGGFEAGTRTLIWHGRDNILRLAGGVAVMSASTPAVHDFDRVEPGSYTVHTYQKYESDELPVGFEIAE